MQDCTQVTCVKPNTSLLPVTSVPSGGVPPETWILCNTTHLKPTSSSSPCKQLCVLKQADLNTDSPDNLLSLIRCLLSFPFGFSAINWQSETEFARWDVGDVSKRHLTEQFMAKLWTPAGSSGAKIYIYILFIILQLWNPPINSVFWGWAADNAQKNPNPGASLLTGNGRGQWKRPDVFLLPTSPFCSLYKYQLLNDPLNSTRSPHVYKHLKEDVQIMAMHRAASASLGDAELQTKPGFICLLTERMGLLPFLTHLWDCKGLFNPADKGITKTSGLKLKLKQFGLEIGHALFTFFFFFKQKMQ